MLFLALSLLAATAFAEKFLFMNQSLADKLKQTDDSFKVQVNRAILNECIYETETVKLWGDYADFDYFKVETCPTALRELEKNREKTGNIYTFTKYNNRRIITAYAAGAMNKYGSVSSCDNVISHAEYAKKPLGTRVGRLLKEQHMQWITNPASLDAINNCPELRDYLNRAQKRSYAWGLFVQVMLIFGFVDVNNPKDHINLLRLIEQSTFYKIYLERDHIILPTIDRALTLMLYDPTMQKYRKDAYSTLLGKTKIDLKPEERDKPLPGGDWICDMDRMVIDYLQRQHRITYHPKQLFA